MKAILYILLLTVIFLGFLIWGVLNTDGLVAAFSDIMIASKAPAVTVMIADLYIGFLILAGWVFYRDGATPRAALVSLAILVLGNIAALAYILFLLVQTRGDVWHVLLGRNK